MSKQISHLDIDAMSHASILVIGDVMLDEYIKGSVPRMSPESPVPLLVRDTTDTEGLHLERLGGAGNAARNVASYGARVTLVGSVAADEAGAKICKLAKSHEQAILDSEGLGITCRLIRRQKGVTTHKLRAVNNKLVQLLRIDNEKIDHLDDEEIALFRSIIEEEIPKSDAIIVSDYAKGFITTRIFEIIKECARGKTIVVDPKELSPGRYLKKYIGAHSIIPNESELKNTFAQNSGAEILFAGPVRELMSSNDVLNVICTRGEKGVMYLMGDEGEAKEFRGPKVEVADVTGASDTFTATYTLAYCATGDVERSIRLAEAASRGKVGKPMTGTITTAELKMLVDPAFKRRASAKVCSIDDFVERCLVAKSNGQPVSFITGCFDILHKGHLSLFDLAGDLDAFTAVAVNSDAYIRSVKRPEGAYLDQDARALLVGSLAMVDVVCVFPDLNPKSLIERIVPNALIMGEEYRGLGEALPGREVVEQAGGKVLFVPEVPLYRSSSIIKALRE